MEAFTFVLKTFLFTVVLVWITQFKIDGKPIEKHFLGFVHGSSVTEPFHRIADGSRKLANDGWAEVKDLVNGVDTGTKISKTNTGTTRKASTFKWSFGSDSNQDAKKSDTTEEDSDRESEDLDSEE